MIVRHIRHTLAHWTGCNFGSVVTATSGCGTVWIGFRCAACGKVSGIHASYLDMPPESKFT